MKDLKEKHRREIGAALSGVEDEGAALAREAEERMSEEFARERRLMADRHAEERVTSSDPGVEARQAVELEQLCTGQEQTLAAVRERMAKATAEKKARLRAILEQRALNELRLAKTINNDEENELRRLKDTLGMDAEQVRSEEDLHRLKEALMEKLKLHERRQKAKAMKEKELLEGQLKEMETLERDAVTAVMASVRDNLAQRVRARCGDVPAELAEELDRIARIMGDDEKAKMDQVNTQLTTARLLREKELVDRQNDEKSREIASAQAEVNKLVAAKQRLAETPDAPVPEAARRAVDMMRRQKQLRQEMERRRVEAASSPGAPTPAEIEQAAKDDAAKQIAAREAAGERLTEEQKQAVLEECRRVANRTSVALSGEQAKQQAEAAQRLEGRRRRMEAQKNRKQVEEMTAELRRQEEEQREKERALAAQIAVAPTAAALPEAVVAEERKREERLERAKEQLRRKHEDEQRQLEAQLEDDIKRAQDKELQRIKADAQRRKNELVAAHSAQESMQLTEAEMQRLVDVHEKEMAVLEKVLGGEESAQRAKLQEQLDARRRKKKTELSEKQRQEAMKETQRQETDKEAFVRQAKLEAEQKAINDAMRTASAAKVEDVASVVMGGRHHEEVAALLQRQQRRRAEELAALVERHTVERDEVVSRAEGRIEGEVAKLPLDTADRQSRVDDLRGRGRKMIAAKLEELARKADEDQQALADSLDLAFAEEQVQLKLRQWKDIAAASGMEAPETAMASYQQRAMRRQQEGAADELEKFRQEREAEGERMHAKLAQEKAEAESKLNAEMEKMRRQQEEEMQRKQRQMMDDLKREQQRREERLQALRMAGADEDKLKDTLMQQYKEQEAMIRDRAEREKQSQQEELRKKLERRRQRAEGKAKVTVVEPAEAAKAADASAADSAALPAAPLPPPPQDGSVPAANVTYQQWVDGVVRGIHASPIMEKLVRIERMLQAQVRSGILSYYLDTKDLQLSANEGRLEVVEPSALSSSQFLVYFFAMTVRDAVARSGIALPAVRVQIARALPNSPANATAFRHSYHCDRTHKTLYIRDQRLSAIGEFLVVMLHALAHLKAGDAALSDTDPAFLTDFYGLLEAATEEMFFLRLPGDVAVREPKQGSGYRPASIMSPAALAALEQRISTVGTSGREELLKEYFKL